MFVLVWVVKVRFVLFCVECGCAVRCYMVVVRSLRLALRFCCLVCDAVVVWVVFSLCIASFVGCYACGFGCLL